MKGSRNAELQQDAATNALIVTAAPGVPVPVDVTDRWARQVGQVDVTRVLGAAMSAANPLRTGIYDAAGNRMPAMDATARPGFVDPIDRAARLLGIVNGNLAQLQQKAATFELITEDTGLHTNPRRYEKLHGFTSAPVARAGGVATPLWAAALAAVYPAAGRTAGQISTVYTFVIENPTQAAVTAWLEVGGAAITPPYHVNSGDTVVISYAAGMTTGNVNVNLNASANTVVGQIMGTQDVV